MARVLVTGAFGSLGTHVVKRLLEDDHDIAAVTRRKGATAARLFAVFGPSFDKASVASKLVVCRGDAADLSDMRSVVESIAKRWSGLDACVCLAGAYAGGVPFDESTEQQWWSMLESNLQTLYATIRATLAYVKRSDCGRIVSIASRVVQAPPPGHAAYVASKAAVEGFTRAVAAELAGTNATANCVSPSVIDTEANRRAMPGADRRRWTKPEAIADVIAFLLSPASAAINGAVIPV